MTFQNPDNPEETKSTPVWPDHCVQNTFGSEFPKELKNVDRIRHVVKKGHISNREFYSGFCDIWGSSDTELSQLLKDNGITDVFVVGLALDFCVFHTAVGASERGFNTFVLKQATLPVVPADTEATYEKLAKAKVKVRNINDPELGFLRR